MNIHIALYKWKPNTDTKQINYALKKIESLANKVPGILSIATGKNTSKYSEGYTHAILVRGNSRTAINAYRNHPDHAKAAALIEHMEDRGISVDFYKKQPPQKELSQTQLDNLLNKSAKQVTIGASYMHYKQHSYKVLALALKEENCEPYVIYQAEYGARVTFTRSVASWLEKVEVNGKKIKRFEKI